MTWRQRESGQSLYGPASHAGRLVHRSAQPSPQAPGEDPLARASASRLSRGSLQTLRSPGCHCAHGVGHGPKHYLSVSTTGQRPRLTYVSKAAHGEVAEFLDNFRRLRAALNAICAINTELLRRHEDFG